MGRNGGRPLVGRSNRCRFARERVTNDLERMRAAGVKLPAPEAQDEDALRLKLWEVIEWLAEQRSFIVHTDHLSDRALYRELVEEILPEEMPEVPAEPGSFTIIDVLGGWGPDDSETFLRYYADEEARADWGWEGPLPPREKPPFDRDRLLPAPDLEALRSEAEEAWAARRQA